VPAGGRALRLLAASILIVAGVGLRPAAAQGERLVVLEDTGTSRDGTPVFRRHPDGASVASGLGRGFPARILRLYQLEQSYLAVRSGSVPEPAYLLLSSRQGGFPGFGFWLGREDKRHAGFVDLYHQKATAGRFGAMDQIFPHELAHVMVRQLAGEPRRGGSNQMHAIGVRTDAMQAFSEGFAEHFQVMALDDPDRDPATARLLADPFWQRLAEKELGGYRREMVARWSPASYRRTTFPLWFSGNESVMRYYGVKANLYARQAQLPERLIRTSDPYTAYLIESVVPGGPSDPPKPAARMLATEGVVSTLMLHWATCRELRNRYLDEPFYRQFGTTRSDVPPELNVYLKLLQVFHEARPDTVMSLVDAYRLAFPDEGPVVDRLLGEVLLGQPPSRARELWLANTRFLVGTTVFDQWRAAPRPHTFDLNAASLVDLVSVPGVSPALARAIQRRLPVDRLSDLAAVPGVTPAHLATLEAMSRDMAAVRGAGDGDAMSRLVPVFLSYPARAAVIWAAAGVLAAWLYRRVAGGRWWRAALNGLAVSLVTLAVGWITWPSFTAALAPVATLAVPAALLARRRSGSWPRARVVAAAWVVSALPSYLLLTPLF
jgi:hypothetical protein